MELTHVRGSKVGRFIYSSAGGGMSSERSCISELEAE